VKRIDVDKSRKTKLLYRWLGPYLVKTASLLGYYVLTELDGTILRRTYAGNRLKPFIQREGYYYSPDDEVFDADGAEGSQGGGRINLRLDSQLEDEAIEEYYARNSTQEIEKATGVIVRVPERLSEAERAKYVVYSDDGFESPEGSVGEEEDD